MHKLFPQSWCSAGSWSGVSSLSKFLMQFVCFLIQPGPVQTQPSCPGLQKQGGQTPSSLYHAKHSSMPPASFVLSSAIALALLCPLASINVMVHQWWTTLSQGRTPLLIWLLLMGENTINKFNYPWPISNGGDMGLLFMSSLKYEYEEI